MRLIIAGSRSIRQADAYVEIKHAISEMSRRPSVVLSGCNQGTDDHGWPIGVDRAGELWADSAGIPVERFPVDWNAHGKKAGPLRNQEMVERADALLLIWDGKSRGSSDVKRRAIAAGLEIVEVLISSMFRPINRDT